MSQSSSQTIETKCGSYKSDVRDGMRIDWDVPIPMDHVYELDVEMWPTSIVLSKGHRLAFTIHGQDYDHGLPDPMPQIHGRPRRGEAARHSRSFERPTSSISRWTRSARGFGPA